MSEVPRILDRKRQSEALSRPQIDEFVRGVTSGEVTDAQLGAFTMAVRYNGMDTEEQTWLTLAMRDSGTVLDWPGLDGPVLDKHSTGGVGDWVSLVLAPMVAAAGGFVPMISGRGLGHTGGTLDKLESIPGLTTQLDLDRLRREVRRHGFAMVGQGRELAPADGRTYAIRDVCGTVESIPLIVSSILSKKLAEGLDALVLDVKTGSGAFMSDEDKAGQLARALCRTAQNAGIACRALLTDMNQPLGRNAGNALEVLEAVDYLTGRNRQPDMHEVVIELCAHMLVMGQLEPDLSAARQRLAAVLDSGEAAERFNCVVHAQGGPADFVERAQELLPAAPVVHTVLAPRAGWLQDVDTRALGMTVLRLGGGRVSVNDRIDPGVGLSELRRVGDRLEQAEPLCRIHAATESDAKRAGQQVLAAIGMGENAPETRPAIHQLIE